MLLGLVIPGLSQPLLLLSASLSGGVMLLYSVLLLWMNNRVLGRGLKMPPLRFVALIWSCAFFG
ncbi:MAG TPA: hypothetical protein EYM39_02270 [Candidatus Latescibacteria bacterium]|nr:hypothetical protein [Candidatus Latescibacterota bacterium]HIM55506.1 hypothetical protein [Candidatus Latescibacterota bacterium]